MHYFALLGASQHYCVPGTVGFASDTAAASRISLPSGIFSNLMESGQPATASLAFTAYQDSSLFPLPPSETRHPNFQIASPVIGASIIGQTTISQNVSVFMEIDQVNTLYVYSATILTNIFQSRIISFPFVFFGALAKVCCIYSCYCMSNARWLLSVI